jgi:uncharacterized membrane protein SpoIIM required for sporulation
MISRVTHGWECVFIIILHNNGIIFMFLSATSTFIIPPCPIIIIYYVKGKVGEKM